VSAQTSSQAVVAITDAGIFEKLVTDVLRAGDSKYRSVLHQGVNAAGKTVKSPLDGICFVPHSNPPHMIAVHHTIAAKKDLEKKWLHDPSTVKKRKSSKPTAPAGDLIKTAEIVQDEKSRTPNLHATLVLTTNEEPSEALVRRVNAEGRKYGIEIDIWSRSRVCSFLDNDPSGQWLRYSYLGINQELLSPELLLSISRKNLDIYHPHGDPKAWVPRLLDESLNTALNSDMTFLIAGSGLGKSVACYRKLKRHVEDGGVGIILSDETVSSATTLDQAITFELQQVHPQLTNLGPTAMSICSTGKPILLIIEDINRSGQAQRMVEKIIGWSSSAGNGKAEPAFFNWHLICPLWPEVFSALEDQTRKKVEQLSLFSTGFTAAEGRRAVIARAKLDGYQLSALKAEETSKMLGNDPLLIALHETNGSYDPSQVIGKYIESALSRIASESNGIVSSDFRQALRLLSSEMLINRQINLSYSLINSWASLQGDPVRLINRLAQKGELIRFSGSSDDQKLLFRHDRVRDWLLTDALHARPYNETLANEIVADPFYAEIIGSLLTLENCKKSFFQLAAVNSPLSLFCALKIVGNQKNCNREDILQALNIWLDDPVLHNPSNLHLRWEALAKLSETDAPEVPALVRKFQERASSGQLARLRNGDLSGGIELCISITPGMGAPWRDVQIEHAKLRYGGGLTSAMAEFLRRTNLTSVVREGALRLAGHIADATLAPAIEASWNCDNERSDHLSDYLWAFAECCGDKAEQYLTPVCDLWASLPDKDQENGAPSDRFSVAEYDLRFAFRKWPPVNAISFFVERAGQKELSWPIIYMLHGMNHPKAIVFVVSELAKMRKEIANSDSFSPFLMRAEDEWEKTQEQGTPMQKESRNLLLNIWENQINDKHLRIQAFKAWAATKDERDITLLRTFQETDEIADYVLQHRLKLGDKQAIPALVTKVSTKETRFWWQFGRYIWSPLLTQTLDGSLSERGKWVRREDRSSFEGDWITSELIMRLPEQEAKKLLCKHWSHLRLCPRFVQTALYFATPDLVHKAYKAINESPNPKGMFEFLTMHYGVLVSGRAGITHESQVLVLEPYLDLLSDLDILHLCDECNKHGWFKTRRKLLDSHIKPEYASHKWDKDMFISELDEAVSSNQSHMLSYRIEKFLKADTAWGGMLELLKEWLDMRQSLEVFKVVAEIIADFGIRKDLEILIKHYDLSDSEASLVLADTRFAVYRRSIH